MIKIFSKYLKPYIGKVILVVFATIITTLMNMLLPTLSKRIIDEGVIDGNQKLITQTMIIMLIVSAVCITVSIFSSYMSSKVSMGFSRDLRKSFFVHVSGLSQGDINKIGSTSLISRQTNDITQLQMIIVQMLQMMLVAPIMVVVGIVLAVITAPELSWTLIIMLPVAMVILGIIMKKVSPVFRETQKKLDTVNRVIRENLNGMRVIRAFNREDFEQKHFEKANSDYCNISKKGNKIMQKLMPTMTIVVNAVNVLIVFFGSRYMDNGIVSYGDIQAYVQYVSMVLMAFMLCGMLLIILPKGQTSAQRINEVFDMESSVREAANPEEIPANAESSVKFENVSFTYPGADVPVLSSISFEAKKGQKIAVIGGTGSGKSTLLNLITRDYDATEGSIYVDGINVKKLRLKDLHDRLAVVPQKAFLFGGSIFDNIRYGRENATVEEVEHALYVSQSKEFVDQKEYGMYTYITPAGTNVSGGQRQRLAIARALVRKPDVYIFDDSFSALDFKTDAKIRKLLKKETKNSVMIVVAQRVSTIKDADMIIVLENGKIAGMGTHDELMKSCEAYREISLSQTQESEVTN
ncbi:MAG: ABC transporter ATP-binding protein [Ruminococcus sp.]|nr:ABC transporter ATP-binding protein [Ruminococcus sp.]